MSISETSAGALPWTRSFFWSVRRELWENRAIYVAPLMVAAIVLFGFIVGAAYPQHFGAHFTADPSRLRELPYEIAAATILVVSLLTAAFYCLGALHGERRDRSILFWRSLPVSDLTAVLAKAAVPLVVTPVVVFAVTLLTLVAMSLVATLVLLPQPVGVGSLWAHNPMLSTLRPLSYGLVTLSLWYAPVYAWLLLISSWARRTPILWAVGPWIGLAVVEKLAFGTSNLGDLVRERLNGGFAEAFATTPWFAKMTIDFARPAPLKFLATPDMWIGLALAAAFLAGAVWLRRRGEPL